MRKQALYTRDKDQPSMNDPPQDASGFLTTEKLGPNQALTPEGFLLCKDVPIARVGWMLYGPNDGVPVEPGEDGLIRIYRGPDVLFTRECISSYEGKPVTNEHPEELVGPDNWAELSKGTCMNARRGQGDDADVILADLLITDAEVIKAVRTGKREVSCGYLSDYVDDGDGEGKQLNIIGNHVALVERGRCGPRCAIGDQQTIPTKELSMPTPNRGNGGNVPIRTRLSLTAKKLVKDMLTEMTSDPDLSTEDEDDLGGDDNHQHIHIHMNGEGGGKAAPAPGATDDDGAGGGGGGGGADMESRMTACEKGIAEILAIVKGTQGGTGDGDPPPAKKDGEGDPPPAAKTDDEDPDAPPADKDDKSATMDSAALETSFKSLQAQCEILIPGFRTPTFDGKQARKFTVDTMCATRRKVLDSLYATADGQQLIDSVADSSGNLELLSLPCAKVTTIFNAAAGAKKLLNNRAATVDANRTPAATPPVKSNVPQSIAELNAAMNKHYSQA